MEKFTISQTKEYFDNYGYLVLDNDIKEFGIGTKLNIQDKEGYCYFLSRHQFYGGNRNNKVSYCPQKFAIQNPYTIENIKHWIIINKKTFSFDHGEYVNNWDKTLFFKCNKCKEVWDTQWSVIEYGRCCPYCAGKRISSNNNLIKIRPDLASEWNYERNGTIIPENVFPRSEKKFWWICSKCKYEWVASVYNRNANSDFKSTNCPRCRRSTGELKIEKILKDYSIFNIAEKIFPECRYKNPLAFDFYLPNNNVCIEFQGHHHYVPIDFAGNGEDDSKEKFEEQQIKDKIKEKYCNENNLLLIRIPYWEYENIETILADILNLPKL